MLNHDPQASHESQAPWHIRVRAGLSIVTVAFRSIGRELTEAECELWSRRVEDALENGAQTAMQAAWRVLAIDGWRPEHGPREKLVPIKLRGRG